MKERIAGNINAYGRKLIDAEKVEEMMVELCKLVK